MDTSQCSRDSQISMASYSTATGKQCVINPKTIKTGKHLKRKKGNRVRRKPNNNRQKTLDASFSKAMLAYRNQPFSNNLFLECVPAEQHAMARPKSRSRSRSPSKSCCCYNSRSRSRSNKGRSRSSSFTQLCSNKLTTSRLSVCDNDDLEKQRSRRSVTPKQSCIFCQHDSEQLQMSKHKNRLMMNKIRKHKPTCPLSVANIRKSIGHKDINQSVGVKPKVQVKKSRKKARAREESKNNKPRRKTKRRKNPIKKKLVCGNCGATMAAIPRKRKASTPRKPAAKKMKNRKNEMKERQAGQEKCHITTTKVTPPVEVSSVAPAQACSVGGSETTSSPTAAECVEQSKSRESPGVAPETVASSLFKSLPRNPTRGVCISEGNYRACIFPIRRPAKPRTLSSSVATAPANSASKAGSNC